MVGRKQVFGFLCMVPGRRLQENSVIRPASYDTSLGFCLKGDPAEVNREDIALSQSRSELLIHNTPDRGPATAFGTCPRGQSNNTAFLSFRHVQSGENPTSAPIMGANFSSAPLKDVTRIKVFKDEELGVSRGV